MKKLMCCLMLFIGTLVVGGFTQAVAEYNFGDFKSVTLVTKAWEALTQGDNQGAIAYTQKCIEMYEQEALKMQSSLTEVPAGATEEIHKNFWALNDVSTAYFIQGKALAAMGATDEAKVAFEKVTKELSFGQCWDPKGWFWVVAKGAEEELAKIGS